MKSRLSLVVFLTGILSGCYVPARLYPVQGPLSTQTPAPVYVAKLKGQFYSGSFSIVLSDGEAGKGHWKVVPRPTASTGAATTSDSSTEPLSEEWDAVYGAGFYVAHVLGTRLYARAVVTGNRGTVLTVEMYRPDTENDNTPSAIRGVAKDNKGNLYKVAF